MRKGGTETNGYSFKVDVPGGLIVLTASGFWDSAIAARFRQDFVAIYDEFGGRPWDILTDGSTFVPQKPEIQAVIGELMGMAPSRGMKRAANVVNSKIDELQLKRIAAENKMENIAFFRTVADARKWLGRG